MRQVYTHKKNEEYYRIQREMSSSKGIEASTVYF